MAPELDRVTIKKIPEKINDFFGTLRTQNGPYTRGRFGCSECQNDDGMILSITPLNFGVMARFEVLLKADDRSCQKHFEAAHGSKIEHSYDQKDS